MLGRLEIGIDEVIDEYSNLVDTLAQSSKPLDTGTEKAQRRFAMVEMKETLIKIISSCGFNQAKCRMQGVSS